MSAQIFSNTPTVRVTCSRGLAVRDIAYHRHPGAPDDTDLRITRHRYHARGFLAQSADPRLHAAGLANFTWSTNLAGAALRAASADAGITLSLNDAAGRPLLAISNLHTADDGTEDLSGTVTRTWQYEVASLAGRPLSIKEQVTGESARVTERFAYAGNTDAEKALNLAGTCVSHYDTAGLMQTDSTALTGAPRSVTRRLLKDADNPDTLADWQGADAAAWNDLLDGETFTTLSTADALGAVLTAADATGNLQRSAYNVAGLLAGSWLTVKDGTEQIILRSLKYSAAGQKLREEHGNGVVTTYEYEAETQRLTGIKAERPSGHAAGTQVLQELRYAYDPVGNVLKVSNDAAETRFWRNQKVVPENAYTYDSLYQLVSASGRERATAGQQGNPSATVPLPTDASAYTNYTRTYTYDEAGNLTQVRHSAPATNNSYTTNITLSDKSNRGVLSKLTENPADVDALFTAGGQQKRLQPGQTLTWTPRNELLQVTPVVRDGATGDRESYRYDAASQRILKVSVQKSSHSVQTQRALYLPGLALRSTRSGETETQSLQVITVGEAGRAQVRVLHWERGRPEGIRNDQIRYSFDNLTGSSGLELDEGGNIISLEEYYPYGGTAVWTARSAVEADYKTLRYSGKERDATGLYYYGYRYYQPWAGRWLSADPAGTIDGLNLFRMARNNTVTFQDVSGTVSVDVNLKNMAVVTGGMISIYMLYRHFQGNANDNEQKENHSEAEYPDDIIASARQHTSEKDNVFFKSEPPFLTEIPHKTTAYDGFNIKNFSENTNENEKELIIIGHGRMRSKFRKIYDSPTEINFYTREKDTLAFTTWDAFRFQTQRSDFYPVMEKANAGEDLRDHEIQHINVFDIKYGKLIYHSKILNRDIIDGKNINKGNIPIRDVLTVNPGKNIALSKILRDIPAYKKVHGLFCRVVT